MYDYLLKRENRTCLKAKHIYRKKKMHLLFFCKRACKALQPQYINELQVQCTGSCWVSPSSLSIPGYRLSFTELEEVSVGLQVQRSPHMHSFNHYKSICCGGRWDLEVNSFTDHMEPRTAAQNLKLTAVVRERYSSLGWGQVFWNHVTSWIWL